MEAAGTGGSAESRLSRILSSRRIGRELDYAAKRRPFEPRKVMQCDSRKARVALANREFRRYGIVVAALFLSGPLTAQPIRFNRDVRPILADKCYTCHGPDKRTRRSPLLTGSLRLLQSRCC